MQERYKILLYKKKSEKNQDIFRSDLNAENHFWTSLVHSLPLFGANYCVFQCCTAGKLWSKDFNLGRLSIILMPLYYYMYCNYICFFETFEIKKITNCLQVVLINKFNGFCHFAGLKGTSIFVSWHRQ